MAEDPWVEGRQAWRRLSEWIQFDDGVRGSHPPDALRALGDVGLVRRLLDQAEFEAVRSARKQGRSWSEIAVRLGVTRQSAWERWRDVDDDATSAGDVLSAAVGDAAAELTGQARERRRRSTAVVPDVVGKSWTEARLLLRANRLVGIDVDGLTSATDRLPGGVVVDQSPEAGASVPPGSSVKLWLTRGGGGSGVREPRRPMPDSSTGTKQRDELTDEAV